MTNPNPEPRFTLKGSDKLALPLLRFYLRMAKDDNQTEAQQYKIIAAIKLFNAYRLYIPPPNERPRRQAK